MAAIFFICDLPRRQVPDFFSEGNYEFVVPL
jgi:hypothetical protein